jgi:hypothetical protein
MIRPFLVYPNLLYSLPFPFSHVDVYYLVYELCILNPLYYFNTKYEAYIVSSNRPVSLIGLYAI